MLKRLFIELYLSTFLVRIRVVMDPTVINILVT